MALDSIPHSSFSSQGVRPLADQFWLIHPNVPLKLILGFLIHVVCKFLIVWEVCIPSLYWTQTDFILQNVVHYRFSIMLICHNFFYGPSKCISLTSIINFNACNSELELCFQFEIWCFQSSDVNRGRVGCDAM